MKIRFSKKELEECSNTTFEKLIIHLPMCNEDVHLNIGKDDWGVRFISYGDIDKMWELLNMIYEWKEKAEQLDELIKNGE